MGHFQQIQLKLKQFVRRFYVNELLKGIILFFAIGLLYFLFTLFVEYVLWLNPTARTVLFWLFVAVEAVLFYKFIAIPLLRLFELKKGISQAEASQIIGRHFPEVNDKLLNVLQLNQSPQQSELLMASIDQKSTELSPVPFKLAVDFKTNTKYLKYALIPVLILLLSFITGKINWFSDSYERVVNYNMAYEPPAPFQFFVLNEDLNVVEGEAFNLEVETAGTIVPENAEITYNGETYFLQNTSAGKFKYEFTNPKEAVTFQISANGVTSKPYTLNVINAPVVTGFEMVLDYPSYTGKRDEVLKSTGNATVPQGTKITWKLNTKSTDKVFLYAEDTLTFSKDNTQFSAEKRLYSNFNYSISTENLHLKDYENLSFSIDVIRDEYPEINVKHQVDSLDNQSLYFYGQVSDDYGLNKLQMVYYPVDNEEDKSVVPIQLKNTDFDEFISSFPQDFNLKEGVSYDLYFQVFDNQAGNNKSSKSATFSYRKLTAEELENQQLQQQNETIKDLDKSLQDFEKQEETLEELTRTQREKEQLNYNDKKKLEQFLQRQEQQEHMMKQFNNELQKNLEEFQQDELNDEQKEALKERLEENEKQLQEDEKLLEELNKLQEKINREEFTEKLEELAKQNKNQKRSLEQLLELTKRYYVGKKMEQLQRELEQLAKDENALSNKPKEENTSDKQEELNKKFEDFQKEMDSLQKENNALKKPMDVPRDELDEKSIEEDMNQAQDDLENQEQQEQNGEQQEAQQSQQSAQQKQKSASQKMKKMAQQMQMAMQMSGGQQMQEDAEMLRQILDNLLLFSFNQEDLMKGFKSINVDHNEYSKKLKEQQVLREHFEHIDDSLFALSLRQPKISEQVNKEITNVYFNIDKSLNQLSENELYKGVSAQQYTVTSANNLADFLSNVMDNMQMQMQAMGASGQGSPSPGQKQGQGGGEMQLPDIIKSQEELSKQMGEGMEKQQGQGQKGEEGEKGQQNGNKDGGESGQSGSNGKGEKEGQGQLNNEEMSGELYQIYQQQQKLRQALEDVMQKQGRSPLGNQLLRQMEEVEMDLLNKGFTKRTQDKMKRLQHQLLKLENASFRQGQDNKRESNTNKKDYNKPAETQLLKAKEYFNTTEILNKQSLPLQKVYKEKLQQYFKSAND